MTADLFDDIRRAVQRRFGSAARLENIVVPTLGGSNRTVAFDLVDGAARRRLVSRQETYVAPNSPFLPSDDQFRLLQVAFAHGIPVPEPVFAYEADDGAGHGFVTAFVGGETMPNRILGDPGFAAVRPRLAAQAGAIFAALHAIDPAEVDFLARYADSDDPIAAQRARLDSYDEAHPAIELGLRWLERHRPPPGPRCFLHGDLRTGNFIVGADGIAAVLDWECSHLGAGVEDLGWLCTRSWRFGRVELPVGGFGNRADLFAAYEAAGGARVDPDAVRYWEIFGLVRWAVLNVMQAHGHVFGGRRSLPFAACGRNTSVIEYDLMMTLAGRYD
ncbi:phosphotransferase family protein [Vineibacter terrae]|uniref:Phosphotransferase family protein n=1 Tax=Vineibacter terrae TaxID=2586908 RepID=A0A5C8PDM0_9HYPH|nr:phosphotransferase family protein [Vineibacter terrae]TXL71837.1 phosphotransferase family protein [Vineibacter terrae]